MIPSGSTDTWTNSYGHGGTATRDIESAFANFMMEDTETPDVCVYFEWIDRTEINNKIKRARGTQQFINFYTRKILTVRKMMPSRSGYKGYRWRK